MDSLTAAILLKRNPDIELFAIHLNMGGNVPEQNEKVRDIAARIDIPLYIVECSRLFQTKVIDYFLTTYAAGKTPNPCMVCNKYIKFGIMLDKAIEKGASFLSTGHYADIKEFQTGFRLIRGKDTNKDQSYFLWALSQAQLSRIIFPLAKIYKKHVPAIVLDAGFKPQKMVESQEICFIPDNDYKSFIEKHKDKFLNTSGEIVDKNGKILGRHNGIYQYTIGQRKGMGIPAEKPLYVININPENNQIVAGFKEDTFSKSLIAESVNCFNQSMESFKGIAKIRYRHKPSLCTVFPINQTSIRVIFDSPQSSITPGQGVVVYQDDIIATAGVITKTEGGLS